MGLNPVSFPSSTDLFPTLLLRPPQQQPAAPQQDALDKGVSGILDKSGHHQQGGTVEKISDGIRNVFKKATGKGEHLSKFSSPVPMCAHF